jgi:hypothetical protein
MTKRPIDWSQWQDLPGWARLTVVLGIVLMGAAVPEAMILIGIGGFELLWMVTFATFAPTALLWIARWRRWRARAEPVARTLGASSLARPQVFGLAVAGATSQCLLAAPMLAVACAMLPLLWKGA